MKRRKIFILSVAIIVIAAAYLTVFRVIFTPAGPGVRCNYIFKSPYDFAHKPGFILDDNGKIIGSTSKIGNVILLNDGYLLMPHYNCDQAFYKKNVLANIDELAITTYNDPYLYSLIYKDTYSEFYYCTKDPENNSVNFFNKIISEGKLSSYCQKVK